MTHTVFFSGSRKISRLNQLVRSRIDNVIKQRFHIVVGDANGADKAMQSYLTDQKYENVTIYCANGSCRNNIGDWDAKAIPVPEGLSGRDYYTQKDLAMAKDADYGFVLWDGKSVGSVNNILKMIEFNKPVVVFLTHKHEFFTLKDISDVFDLLKECDPADRDEISKKTSLHRRLREIARSRQPTLALG